MSVASVRFSEQFRQNLSSLRHRVRMSQEEVAERAQLHRTEISLLERGGRIPRIDTLLKLGAAIEATPDELLSGIEWVPSSEPSGRGAFWTRLSA